MPTTPAKPVSAIRIKLPPSRGLTAEKDVRMDLSVVEPVGESLFVASDETATIERLRTRDGGKSYVEHKPERLSAFFTLPLPTEEDGDGETDGKKGKKSGKTDAKLPKRGEVDIEGVAFDPTTGYLWVTGSHSLARRKPKPDEHDNDGCLERLTEVRQDPNRYLLGRIPCVPTGDGGYDLVKEGAGPDGGTLRAACLKMGKGWNALAKLLKKDIHVGRFLHIPAKENGFDVEGLAARGDRVWLGCRGPVLRGWATIIEVQVEDAKKGRLHLKPVAADGRCYRKHFLDLDGLGIRDMKMVGDDLLILAGPTMDLDGPVVLWRWPNAAKAEEETVIARKDLVRVMNIPHGFGYDHAEGIGLLHSPGGKARLVVAYDNPGEKRLHGEEGIDLDLFDLP